VTHSVHAYHKASEKASLHARQPHGLALLVRPSAVLPAPFVVGVVVVVVGMHWRGVGAVGFLDDHSVYEIHVVLDLTRLAAIDNERVVVGVAGHGRESDEGFGRERRGAGEIGKFRAA
jgi:hypothetical protein